MKTPSIVCHLACTPGRDKPTTSFCPLIGRPYCCPVTPRYTSVSTCLSMMFWWRPHSSPSQMTTHSSPESPSPSSPNAEISCLSESGDEKWWEWRFLLVVKCCSRIVCPQATGSPLLQACFIVPFMSQLELWSSCCGAPVTDCCPEPDPYLTSWECSRTL